MTGEILMSVTKPLAIRFWQTESRSRRLDVQRCLADSQTFRSFTSLDFVTSIISTECWPGSASNCGIPQSTLYLLLNFREDGPVYME